VLGATLLFAIQKPVVRWILSRKGPNSAPKTEQPAVTQLAPPTTALLIGQFFVGVYGGYFGAGAGIIMLAALGFMGLTNIHQMNGLKNWGGVCMNGIAALTFVVMGIVNWPIALAMATGGVIGGYTTAGLARRAPQQLIRNLVTLIGLSAAVWLFIR
jgi:uncharacterized membrane protein YfcA